MDYDFKYAVETFKKTVQTQYWDVDGRMSRKDFWHYVSIALMISFGLAIIEAIIPALSIVGFVVSLALLAPGIGVGIRRVHDIGQPWFMALIPFYNIYLACQPGDRGPNAYGSDPLSGLSTAEVFE